MGRSGKAVLEQTLTLKAAVLVVGVLGILALFAAAPVSAAPPLLWQTCAGGGLTGGGLGGQCLPPSRGVATAPAGIPNAGHVFLADSGNQRIQEFDAWGEFVKAWGWDVNATDPSTGFEICAADTGDACKTGAEGARGGQFGRGSAQGVAVDSLGNVYVVDLFARRVSKFSPTGQYVLAWGGDVVSEGSDDTGVNEEQTVTVPVSVTAGTFTLSLISATGFSRLTTGSNQIEVGVTSGEFHVGDELSGGGLQAGTLIMAINGTTLTLSKAAVDSSGKGSVTAVETTPPIEWNASAGGVGGVQESLESLAIIEPGDVSVSGGPGASGTPFTITFTGGLLAHDDVPLLQANSTSLSGGSVTVATEVNGGGPEICHVLSVCKEGAIGTANGEFGDNAFGSFIGIGPGDKVYVGDVGRIQRFNADGAWQESITAGLAGEEKVQSLALDSSGNIYAGINGKNDVRKWSAAGALLAPQHASVNLPRALATDTAGNLYVVSGSSSAVIRKFSPAGVELESWGQEEPPSPKLASPTGIATGSACLTEGADVYVANNFLVGITQHSFLRAYGSLPDKEIGPGEACAPAQKPPAINSQFATSVDSDRAQVRALINPRFWADTTYFVEYGTGDCAAGGCEARVPVSDASLGGGITNAAVMTASVLLADLTPNTTYHYRFVAQSSGGGPVHGIDPDGAGPKEANFEEGLQGTFTTTGLSGAPATCPNEALRGGPSAHLPNCRAYELVSPIDKNGGDIQALEFPGKGGFSSYKQSAPSGGAITYSSATAFGDAPSGPYSSQYISRRGDKGWSTHGISPPRGTAIFEGNPQALPAYDNETMFEAFTPDLASAWTRDDNVLPLTADGIKGYVNLYRRDNIADSFEALTREGPYGLATEYLNDQEELAIVGEGPGLRFQGYSADLSHQVFASGAALTEDAAPVEGRCVPSTSASNVSFQWLRNGVPIPGASEQTYVATAADESAVIQCQVFALNSNAGATMVAIEPFWTAAPPPATPPPLAPSLSVGIPAPTSSGPLPVNGPGGQILTCDANAAAWGRNPETFAYQWYRNGKAITGATEETYTVTKNDLAFKASTFQCTVTGSNAGGGMMAASRNLATSPAPDPPAPDPIVERATMKGGKTQLYDLHDGQLELVSVLPGGEANPDNSYAGTLGQSASNRLSNVEHAVSEDGERIFWTSQSGSEAGPGKIYARIGGEETILVSEDAEALSGTSSSRYWSAARDGSELLFTSGEDLYRLDVDKALAEEAGATTLIAHKVMGVAGAADDLSRIYFASKEALDEGAVAGLPNLYLEEGGEIELVAALSNEDAPDSGQQISPVNPTPIRRASRVTPDGGTLAFQAVSNLTGYETFDPLSGKRFTEVYHYDAGSDQLVCVSCNPSGATPSGLPKIIAPYSAPHNLIQLNPNIGTSGKLPTWEREQNESNLLSEDGNRLFFESYEALVPRDTNGTQDVYEWEAAPSASACDELGAARYVASANGCLSLISMGTSAQPSEFIDASANGDDVFIATTSSINPKDEGLIDIYDARVGGGFSEEIPPPACVGDACQSVPAPPPVQTPASATFKGPGNVRKCPKGKRRVTRKGKSRCVPKKQRKKQRKQHNRQQQRAAR